MLINVPISIASAMAASCVPTLTMSFAQKDMKKVREQINSAMRFIMVISFPCAIGLAVLGEPICRLLFPGTHRRHLCRYHDVGWGNGGCVLCNVYAFKRTAAGH